ncbi:DNA replication ATP-dependent helicase/nuclease DNA2 [Erysiphe neolycopersici]|uniref:DNA replication ATP-dependent helicase/nuclease n=1 Tax=Erysiphe neolycopersici TaxID=212602 RepID=A0A420I7U4_9PEZI|nr:DNA replication ATP-dependent helicase/nuclease DNA2 [Erysiphe neolycopersici]
MRQSSMPIQRSFSEQNHSAKAKQPWGHNRSMQKKQNTNLNSKPLKEKLPLPVSTATKNKLSNFHYGAQVNTQKKTRLNLWLKDEKENEDTVNERIQIAGAHKLRETEEEKEVLSTTPCNNSKNKIPSTPASKLALPDLIGMVDFRRMKQELSPEERLEWDHKKGELHNFALNINSTRAANKRARSSSPLGSSPTHAPIHFDPGSELWGRYSRNGSKFSTSQSQSISSLAHIMNTSSPKLAQEGSNPRCMSEFRRANSCGDHFPKRKKFSRIDHQDNFTESPLNGSSKLSILIGRVREGLNRFKPPHVAQRKLLNLNSISEHAKTSTEKEISKNCSTIDENRLKTTLLLEEKVETSLVEQKTNSHYNLSGCSENTDYGDFDDDELDSSLFQACKTNTGTPIFLQNSESVPLKSLDHSNSKPCLSEKGLSPKKSPYLQTCHKLKINDKSNDFDDSEDDLLSVDLELLVSQYDNQSVNELNNSLPKNMATTRFSNRAKTESEDEFDDDGLDDDDFKAAEASTLQTPNSLTTLHQKARAIQRYLVVDIFKSTYEDTNSREKIEKILLLRIEHTKRLKHVHLRGIWVETPVIVDVFVHVIGSFNEFGHCYVDDAENLLILHPDHLISSTVVADSFSCIRRAVLQDRIKATSEPNPSLVYGTLLHEIFQAAMVSNRWDSDWLTELIKKIAVKHVEDLYSVKIQIPDAVIYLQDKMFEMQSWANKFISPSPKPEAIVKSLNGKSSFMCIDKLLDIEEHIWSPTYGLKGNIDATVQVTVKDEKFKRTLTVPFELKTGKNPSTSHIAQTALYSLLLSDRYDIEVAYGILYYMETSETKQIPAIRHELRHMIMQRNELACFVRERSFQLPAMLKKQHMCSKCYAKVPCSIYHKFVDSGTGESSGMKGKFDEIVMHLTLEHKDFFLKWDDLLTKEETEYLKYRRELWTMLSSEREKLGRCFSNVVIKPGSSEEDPKSTKISRYKYIMIKLDPTHGFSFLDSQITAGEPIVVSDEEGHFALANGFVTQVWKHKIAVQVDRRLHNARIRQPNFDEENNQVFTGIMNFTKYGGDSGENQNEETTPAIKYRLDKDEFSSGMATVRNNLIQIMEDSAFGSRKIRNLVVDLVKPSFKAQISPYEFQQHDEINIDQRRAIEKVMNAEDYALILGMPGTGKTTTIAYMIRALISQGKSVLLTSYTHTAVDNILLKLKDQSIPILRLGQLSKISPEVQDFVTLASEPKSSFEEIRSDWHDTPIVATTCLGINHAIFNERIFDYCIVDEASQITLPVCLGPIRLSHTFVLVGDHYQLPPLVQNEDARKGGLDISLFMLLSEKHPDSVVYLEHQYRMCEDIMTLSNSLIYNGRLKCGNRAVAQRELHIPNLENLQYYHTLPTTSSSSKKMICLGPVNSRCWLHDLIIPATKVSFINTDPLLPLSREEAKGNRIVNPTEARICTLLVHGLLSVGVAASSIGVMTHYRSQLALLNHYLRAHNQVEMHTADRFQGRDKEVIILSLVRSNDAQSIGELLKDWRRINVAFTRAKTKLLVIGSRETLKGSESCTSNEEEMVARFVSLMEKNNWVYDLPSGALEDHPFVETQTQATVSFSQTNSQNLEINKASQKNQLHQGPEIIAEEEKFSQVEGVFGNQSSVTSGNCKKFPNKRMVGKRPFNKPQVGILADVMNEALG